MHYISHARAATKNLSTFVQRYEELYLFDSDEDSAGVCIIFCRGKYETIAVSMNVNEPWQYASVRAKPFVLSFILQQLV